MEEIKEIKEIIEAVQENWVASDGGLTMAAADLIQFGRSVIRHIEAGDVEWCQELDPFDADTGTEGDIISLAHAWARKKLRI